MTAVEAVRYLRKHLPTIAKEQPDLTVACAALLDHATRLEQALTLIRDGVGSALRSAPDNAIIGVPVK